MIEMTGGPVDVLYVQYSAVGAPMTRLSMVGESEREVFEVSWDLFSVTHDL